MAIQCYSSQWLQGCTAERVTMAAYYVGLKFRPGLGGGGVTFLGERSFGLEFGWVVGFSLK